MVELAERLALLLELSESEILELMLELADRLALLLELR